MKNNAYFLNLLLTCVLGLVLLVCVLIRTFLPAAVLPRLDIPAMTVVSLLALLTEAWLAPGAKRRYLPIFLLSALTFGLLPVAVGMASEWWKLALVGGSVFTALTALFTSALDRQAAPAVTAAGMYLAVQALTGIFL